jgi:hypothetical protein
MEAMTRVVVEVLDSHDRVHLRERLVLGGDKISFTVGRGAAADVIIDESCSAALHATVELGADGKWRVADLGSINGVIVGRTRHSGVTDLELPDGIFQIGRTRLRVRGEHETLPPERVDRRQGGKLSGYLPAIAVTGAVVCMLFTVYFSWLIAPRDTATLVGAALVSLFISAIAWIAIWALLTRVLRGEARWVTHAAIALGTGAALLAVDWVVALGWFAFSLPGISMRHVLLIIIASAVALYWHISTAAPVGRRTALLLAIAGPLLTVGTTTWVEARKHTRDVNYISEREQLFPPALRLRQGGSADVFFGRAASLKTEADRRRKAVENDDTSDAPDAEDDE